MRSTKRGRRLLAGWALHTKRADGIRAVQAAQKARDAGPQVSLAVQDAPIRRVQCRIEYNLQAPSPMCTDKVLGGKLQSGSMGP